MNEYVRESQYQPRLSNITNVLTYTVNYDVTNSSSIHDFLKTTSQIFHGKISSKLHKKQLHENVVLY